MLTLTPSPDDDAPTPKLPPIPHRRRSETEERIGQMVQTALRDLEQWQTRLSALLDAALVGTAEPPSAPWLRLFTIYSMNATRLTRVARDLRALQSDDEKDDIPLWMHDALDQLREEHGWDV